MLWQKVLIEAALLVPTVLLVYLVIRWVAGRGIILKITAVLLPNIAVVSLLSYIYGHLEMTVVNTIAVYAPGALLTALCFYWMFRVVVRPLQNLINVASAIAKGDLSHDIDARMMKSNDELGQLARTLQQAVDYQRQMAGLAEDVAEGNLGTNIAPQSEADVLGNAFHRMKEQLQRVIRQITISAGDVNHTAGQMSGVSSQVRQTVQMVTTSFEQISHATQQQADLAAETNKTVVQISEVIDGVAHGAQDQARAIAATSDATATLIRSLETINQTAHTQTQQVASASGSSRTLEAAIAQIADHAQTVSKFIERTLSDAQSGQQTSRQAESGMDQLGATTHHLAQRVRELGDQSAQIGSIIEVIDAIAAQTNLLALNAAIEAARAGEHGKGFAVVADEVRKLAERASEATGQIGTMVTQIQHEAEQTVEAMNQAGAEVEAGVSLTRAASAALESIAQGTVDSAAQVKSTLSAVEAAREAMSELQSLVQMVEQVSAQNQDLVRTMQGNAGQVMESLEQVSAVVEENTASAEEMSAGAGEILHQIEQVTSASQNTHLMIDELAEVMQTIEVQTGQVNDAALGLQGTAADLDATAGQFVLVDNAAETVPGKAGYPEEEDTPVSAANGHQTLVPG